MIQANPLKVINQDYEHFQETVECQYSCPVHTDARGYIVAIGERRYEDAYRIAREPNPFASICGRVCGAPCEAACRRGKLDTPVAIRALKRFVCEQFGPESPDRKNRVLEDVLKGTFEADSRHEFDISNIKRLMGTTGVLDRESRNTGPKVAVIGSGVAGMTTAHDLNLFGYQVTVFERHPRVGAGGMLSQGVPVFRLDRRVVYSEVDGIASMGIDVQYGVEIGKHKTIRDLRNEGYKAVVVAAGLQLARGIPIPGHEGTGIIEGIDYLRRSNFGEKIPHKGRVIVVGGGDVAMDCARTALRQGATKVQVVCLEPEDGMRGSQYERIEARYEGITIHNDLGPQRYVRAADGTLTGLEFKRVASIFDSQGRFAPSFVEGTESVYDTDEVILAIGQRADVGFLAGVEDEVAQAAPGVIKSDPKTFQTSAPDVFITGDIATGPKLFIDGVSHGHKVARSIHQILSGKKIETVPHAVMRPMTNYETVDRYIGLDRKTEPHLPLAMRKDTEGNFSNTLVDFCYPEQEAIDQAHRCLRCNINVVMDGEMCIACSGCVDICPEKVLKLVPLDQVDNATQLAGGAQPIFGVAPSQFLNGPGAHAGSTDQATEKGAVMLFDSHLCIRCGLCAMRCPTRCITMEKFQFDEELVYAGQEPEQRKSQSGLSRFLDRLARIVPAGTTR
ncbi:MAG: FAD-dependent oxidoreductase [Nitrospirota bacterium]|nr:FAD-dependent oxidoreductase [Nitrospirota bacterium]